MDNNKHGRENVILPSDEEERVAKRKGINYTKLRSGRVRVFTQKEIDILNHSEEVVPFDVWILERKRRWLINSKSCKVRGE